jgi:hypothetical protein
VKSNPNSIFKSGANNITIVLLGKILELAHALACLGGWHLFEKLCNGVTKFPTTQCAGVEF